MALNIQKCLTSGVLGIQGSIGRASRRTANSSSNGSAARLEPEALLRAMHDSGLIVKVTAYDDSAKGTGRTALQGRIPTIFHGRRLTLHAAARKTLGLDKMAVGETRLVTLKLQERTPVKNPQIKGTMNDQLVLARWALTIVYGQKQAEIVDGDNDNAFAGFLAEATSDRLTLVSNALGRAPLSTLDLSPWLTLADLERIAAKEQPNDVSKFNWLSLVAVALGRAHQGAHLMAASGYQAIRWETALSIGFGKEKSAQTKLYFPPPNEHEKGAKWARVGVSRRKLFYAFVRDDNVVRSWKRLKRIEDERIVRLQTQVCLLRDIATPERNWLNAKIIPLPEQQRLLATGKYPFRVTFDTAGQVNKKLMLQKFYVRCNNPLAKQVGAEKGLPTRVNNDGGGIK